ncbi:MAG: type II toxin-antitoxin system PemK/MazF family toxin [Chloroflexota bacterium]
MTTERDVPIRQGDVYWIDVGDPTGSEPAYRRPYVVIQNDVLNQSRLRTVVVCAVTSNLRRAAIPGNVSLEPGEGGLPRPSVVNVTQIYTVDKSNLEEPVGALSPRRLRQILDGIALVLEPREPA